MRSPIGGQTGPMLVIGHRGASADAPENTPEAFRLADEQGADGVELDVRLTRAGALVVRHDPIPLSGEFSGEPGAGADFAAVLDSCGTRMLVNVEIKNDGGEATSDAASDAGPDAGPDAASHEPLSIARLTIDELRRRGPRSARRWLISSFSWSTITACRTIEPDIATAFLCASLDDEVIERVAAAGHAAVHPWERGLTESSVDRCHRAGLAVNTWTCNAPDRLVELSGFGVDGVCTDVPAVALAALGRVPVNPRARRWAVWGTPA